MYIYKYYPLFDDDVESDKRLAPLRNNHLWMSNWEQLNDPTEFSYFIKGKKIFDKMCSTPGDMLIASFSQTKNSLPMWAHYANNHTGFVVKYRAIKCVNNNLYKVRYIKNPLNIFEIGNLCDSNYNDTSIKFERFFLGENHKSIDASRLFLEGAEIASKVKIEICRIKNNQWKYEKEYRIIIPNGLNFLKENLLPFEYAFIEPTQIYTGIFCRKENLEKLVDLSKIWGLKMPIQIKIDDLYR